MSLTKQDLQNIKVLMKEEVTSSEGRMLNAITDSEKSMHKRMDGMDARFDKIEEDIKQVQVATLENFDAIERNHDAIKRNTGAIERNGAAIRKSSDSINYLANKVDLSNQNVSSRFDIHEEKILQVEMQTKSR